MLSKKQYYSKFKSSLDEQLSILRDLSIGHIKSVVEPKLNELSNDFEGDEILIKILILGTPDEGFLKRIAHVLGRELLVEELADISSLNKPLKMAYEIDDFVIHAMFYGVNACSIEYAGLFEGHLGIVAFAKGSEVNSNNFELIKHLFRQHSLIYLYKDLSAPTTDIHILEDKLAVEWVDIDSDQSTLKKLLEKTDFLTRLSFTQSYNALLASDVLNKSAVALVKDAERQNKLNRFGLPIAQNNTKGLQETDPYVAIKYNIQQQLSQLEKSVNDQLEVFFLPGTGSFWGKIFPTIDTLKYLETYEKAKTNTIKVPDEARDLFLEHTRNVLQKQFLKTVDLVNDAVKSLEKDVAKTCYQKNISNISLFVTHLTNKDLQLTLDSAVRIERPYEANVQRKGMYEYFMAVRKYQMVFFMVLSLFGLRSKIDPKVMLVATLALTAFGIYGLRKTVKKEREEQDERELEKAKDNLKDETKRISSEVMQRWRKQLSDYFKSLNVQLLKQIDETSQAYHLNKHAFLEEEKRTYQRMVQNFDNADKQYSLFFRNQEIWQRNQLRIKSDFKSDFMKIRTL